MTAKTPRYDLEYDPEVLEWWDLTPAQRFEESSRLWATFLALGGSLDPEPDSQSPFYFANESSAHVADGGPGLHSVRRRRVQPRRGLRRSGQREKPSKP